jgi:hypothetical protein
LGILKTSYVILTIIFKVGALTTNDVILFIRVTLYLGCRIGHTYVITVTSCNVYSNDVILILYE